MRTFRFLTAALTFSAILGGHETAFAEPEASGVQPVQNASQVFRTPDYTGDLATRSALFGSLGGSRQELANNGVTLDANLTQVTQGVVSGGLDEGWEYSGRGEVTLNADTAKLGLWPGGLLSVLAEGNFGTPLSKNTGSLLGTNSNDLLPEVENSFVLPQVSFTQFLCSKFGIAFGKFATMTSTSGDMNEFAHGKGADNFLNPSLNFNPVISLTIPYSTLGVTGIFLPTSELAVTVGALDPHGAPDTAGLDDLFSNGASFVSEARYTTGFFGMTGHQLLGGSYSTSDYADLDQRAANFIFPGLPVQKAGDSWAAYWNTDQYIYQPDANVNRGVGIFARYGISDGEANPIENFASAGFGGKGMIAGRENDGFGLGYFYAWSADNRITTLSGFGDAQGVEAYYEIALTPALLITPDIQWIDPSQERVDSSWVLGVRVHTIF